MATENNILSGFIQLGKGVASPITSITIYDTIYKYGLDMDVSIQDPTLSIVDNAGLKIGNTVNITLESSGYSLDNYPMQIETYEHDGKNLLLRLSSPIIRTKCKVYTNKSIGEICNDVEMGFVNSVDISSPKIPYIFTAERTMEDFFASLCKSVDGNHLIFVNANGKSVQSSLEDLINQKPTCTAYMGFKVYDGTNYIQCDQITIFGQRYSNDPRYDTYYYDGNKITHKEYSHSEDRIKFQNTTSKTFSNPAYLLPIVSKNIKWQLSRKIMLRTKEWSPLIVAGNVIDTTICGDSMQVQTNEKYVLDNTSGKYLVESTIRHQSFGESPVLTMILGRL